MNLKTGHQLAGGRYRIERVLGQGGFGITYEAHDTRFKSRAKSVAIKEFFVKDFCNRENETDRMVVATQGKVELVERLRNKFIDEANALFELEHTNIVRVTDIFEENGTAYYVMEYVNGSSLSSIVEKNGKLSENEALGYIRQVADALRYVHSQNRLHLDVKPQNIMVDGNGKAVLIDFGVSKQYDEVKGENTSTLLGCTPGYAPIEQIGGEIVEFHAATDVYSLGATLYKLITGITPASANKRASSMKLKELAFPDDITPATRAAIDAAMRLYVENRPQSVGEFLSLLEGNVKAESGKVKTESNDDGATVVASSSTPGGEVSRSDGGENVEKSTVERAKSKDDDDGATEILHSVQDDKYRENSSSTPGGEVSRSDGGEEHGNVTAADANQSESEKSPVNGENEILHSAQNDKKRPDGNTPKRPFNKRLLTIISVAAICIIAVIFGVKSCNDRKAAEAEAQRATAIAEQQRIDAARKAQERTDSIAAEQQRIAKEEAERKRREEYERSNFNINNPPPVPTPKDIKERTILDLLYFPYGCLIEKVNSNESAAKALKENFGRSETVNAFYTGLHRNESYDYTYKGVPIGLCYVDCNNDRSWYIFYFETRSQAETFESLLVEDIKNVGIPLKYDNIDGGMSNRGNSVSIFKWVYVNSPVKITKSDGANIHNSDVVGKYVVELGVYKTKSKSER